MKEFYPLKPMQQIFDRESVSAKNKIIALLGMFIGGVTTVWLWYSYTQSFLGLFNEFSFEGLLAMFAMTAVNIFMTFWFVIYPYFSPYLNKFTLKGNTLTFYIRKWFGKWNQTELIDLSKTEEVIFTAKKDLVKVFPSYKVPIVLNAANKAFTISFGKAGTISLSDTYGWNETRLNNIFLEIKYKFPKIKIVKI